MFAKYMFLRHLTDFAYWLHMKVLKNSDFEKFRLRLFILKFFPRDYSRLTLRRNFNFHPHLKYHKLNWPIESQNNIGRKLVLRVQKTDIA